MRSDVEKAAKATGRDRSAEISAKMRRARGAMLLLLLATTVLLLPQLPQASASPTTAWFQDELAWAQQTTPLTAASLLQDVKTFLQVSLIERVSF